MTPRSWMWVFGDVRSVKSVNGINAVNVVANEHHVVLISCIDTEHEAAVDLGVDPDNLDELIRILQEARATAYSAPTLPR